MSTSERKKPNWDFESGNLALDFVNTIEWRLGAEPVEWLHSYSDLLHWSMDAGLIDEEGARAMHRRATQSPEEAKLAFERSLALREASFRIFNAVAKEEKVQESDLEMLNDVLQGASRNLVASRGSRSFDWIWKRTSLDWMLGPIARSAGKLLATTKLDRVGVCADDRGCAYVFYDTSRNHSRKWCNMESCGNRAKARRYYRRQSDSTRVASTPKS